MPRYALTIEYDGSGYSGWQRVGEGRESVQQALEEAAARIFGQDIEVIGAGRTDAGVHALAQAAHLDAPRAMRPYTLMMALNAQLRPAPIAVLDAYEAADDFHARFSAIGRAYIYRIVNRRADLTLDRARAWRVGQPLDAEAMHAAAQRLVGHHDFTTFRDAQCQAASPLKTLDAIAVSRAGDELQITCAARSFLHRQVRSMVGSLVEVGRGRWPGEEIARRLAAADRSLCGPVAPADGLYLAKVTYPR